MEFEVDPNTPEFIEIMEETGLENTKDVVSNALALFRWARREVAKGRNVASIDECTGIYNPVHLPCFDEIRRRHGIEIDETK